MGFDFGYLALHLGDVGRQLGDATSLYGNLIPHNVRGVAGVRGGRGRPVDGRECRL